jgi:dihydroorotate dehydrogenase
VYRAVFFFLRRLPAEAAHHLTFGLLRAFAFVPPFAWMLEQMTTFRSPRLETRAFGVDFPNPVGLAAGFDKDAKGPDALACLGFGFIEIGTVTAEAQPGNPKPRLFRLTDDRALLNRMGFNNDGARAAKERLERRSPRAKAIVGVNIGKTKVCPPEKAPDDYATSASLLAERAAYCVVNVSSPNTPGLRDLQAIEPLRAILVAARAALDAGSPNRRVPLLVKIAPDLADEDIDKVADLALELGLEGIVAVNTTLSRGGLRTDKSKVEALGAGGVSGAPLKKRALAVLERVRDRVGDRVAIIAVGGIENADDAWERITAGASLVQIYTGFIYGGPFAVRAIAKGIDARLKEGGFATIADAVGSAKRSKDDSIRRTSRAEVT